jgi:hypothetical protein
MKHLLIILSFLLLTSPVIGEKHKGETLYLWGTSSVAAWKEIGDKNIHHEYIGDVENGLPNGKGKLTLTNGMTHIGEYKDGLYHGQGTFIFPDGETYIGEFKDNWKHGQGVENFPDGNKFSGEFNKGKRNGRGVFTWLTGESFDGEYKDNLRHGQGTLTFPIGSKYLPGYKYVGAYKFGKRTHGTISVSNGKQFVVKIKNAIPWSGNLLDEDGNLIVESFSRVEWRHFGEKVKYLGEYKDGNFHGQGILILDNGYAYQGEFKNDLPDGHGIASFPDGSTTIGEFKKNLQHGQGFHRWSNGDEYVGGFKFGKREGYGTYFYKSEGSKYFGTWKNGQEHGQAKVTFFKGKYNGWKYEGSYRDGEMWTGILYEKDGNIDLKLVNGKVK